MKSRPPPPANVAAMDIDRNTTASERTNSEISRDLSDDEGLETTSSKGWLLQEQLSPSGSGESAIGQNNDKAEESSIGLDDGSATEDQAVPTQKRRRVTRACDECRRKKIKCDGKQPCTHCSVYSYDCTYDKPSNRRRNPAPQYVEALENRLQRAEELLRKYMPDVDLTDPDLDPVVQQEFRNRERQRAQSARLRTAEEQQDNAQDSQIVSMIETIGQLDLTDGGEWDFHGISSGAVFLRRMKEHFGGLFGHDTSGLYFPQSPQQPNSMLSLDVTRKLQRTLKIYQLPPKETARSLCYYSLNCATCLLRIVHIPSFYEMVDKLYDQPRDSFGLEDNRSLALLYSAMALGCMYRTTPDDNTNETPYKAAMEEGLKYYTSARLLLQDITECRDLTSLQALLFMIMFLQATSNLSGCYAFIGIALRAALRMGLHRDLPHAKLTPIDKESRRRVFYVIKQMDTYVSALLGFPILLQDCDIDQPLPTEVNDEYITKEAILLPPPGTPSFFEACNAYTRLMTIFRKVIRYIYPLKGIAGSATNGGDDSATPHTISYARIKEIEGDLAEWSEQLPITWRPSQEGETEVVRVRTLLRFAYAHVQMMLYRPFLHYVSPRLSAGKNIDERFYACAAAGISVSRNIVHIGMEIRKQSVLIGPYWFMLYTEFFAILSLVFYALENPDKPGSAEMLADANAGRDTIANLSHRSLAADRVSVALNALFNQLPDKAVKGKKRSQASRKRSAPGLRETPVAAPLPVSLHGRPEEPHRPHSQSSSEPKPKANQRASFDTARRPPNSRPRQLLKASFQELSPLDLPPSSGSPSESSATSSASHLQMSASFFQSPQDPSCGVPNPIVQLDEIMFPSNNPFEYPNQPLVDFQQQHGTVSSGQPAEPHQDSMQFYMPTVYDNIEGQLLGPIQPYLIQPEGEQYDSELPSQVYTTPGMFSHQPQQHNHLGSLAMQQQHDPGSQEPFADPQFRGDWANMQSGTSYQPQ